ncbi:hypothetical protein EWM64_g7314, partial [Hericium alpestre]
MASPDFPSTRRVPNPRNAAPMGPASSSRSVTSLLANRAPGGATPIPPSLQAKMAAMANRANHANHPQPREVDNATAALKHASLNSLAPNPVPPPPAFPRGSPAVRGGLRRNRPGFKLSDITGESSAGPSSAGLGAAPSRIPTTSIPAAASGLPAGPWNLARPSPTLTLSTASCTDPSGKLNFSGKAVLHQSGVDFSNGNSFAINMSQMQLEDELGRGAYGTVKRVLHKPTNVAMAMKEIRLELDESKLSSIIMELDILHRASHPSIVEFYGAFFIESCVYYCMEYMDAGSLDKLYGAGVPEEILARIVGSMVRGLKFLKDELQIIHRDVKPTNVLINRRGAIKLCDFGVSGHLEKSLAKTNIGCQSYMAPERIKGESQNALTTYTVSSDVWSVGLATLEIALGRYPYPPETFFERVCAADCDRARRAAGIARA